MEEGMDGGRYGCREVWMEGGMDVHCREVWVEGGMGGGRYGWREVWMEGGLGGGRYGWRKVWVEGGMGRGRDMREMEREKGGR